MLRPFSLRPKLGEFRLTLPSLHVSFLNNSAGGPVSAQRKGRARELIGRPWFILSGVALAAVGGVVGLLIVFLRHSQQPSEEPGNRQEGAPYQSYEERQAKAMGEGKVALAEYDYERVLQNVAPFSVVAEAWDWLVQWVEQTLAERLSEGKLDVATLDFILRVRQLQMRDDPKPSYGLKKEVIGLAALQELIEPRQAEGGSFSPIEVLFVHCLIFNRFVLECDNPQRDPDVIQFDLRNGRIPLLTDKVVDVPRDAPSPELEFCEKVWDLFAEIQNDSCTLMNILCKTAHYTLMCQLLEGKTGVLSDNDNRTIGLLEASLLKAFPADLSPVELTNRAEHIRLIIACAQYPRTWLTATELELARAIVENRSWPKLLELPYLTCAKGLIWNLFCQNGQLIDSLNRAIQAEGHGLLCSLYTTRKRHQQPISPEEEDFFQQWVTERDKKRDQRPLSDEEIALARLFRPDYHPVPPRSSQASSRESFQATSRRKLANLLKTSRFLRRILGDESNGKLRGFIETFEGNPSYCLERQVLLFMHPDRFQSLAIESRFPQEFSAEEREFRNALMDMGNAYWIRCSSLGEKPPELGTVDSPLEALSPQERYNQYARLFTFCLNLAPKRENLPFETRFAI